MASVEACWLRQANALGIGARLVATDGHALVIAWAEGRLVVEWLRDDATTADMARWLVREALAQCYRLDAAGINKQEMTHPERHMIIVSDGEVVRADEAATLAGNVGGGDTGAVERAAGLRLVMIDFERCARTCKPKNTTQVAQFLGSKHVRELLSNKGLMTNVEALRRATQAYKQSPPAQVQAALEDVFHALVGADEGR